MSVCASSGFPPPSSSSHPACCWNTSVHSLQHSDRTQSLLVVIAQRFYRLIKSKLKALTGGSGRVSRGLLPKLITTHAALPLTETRLIPWWCVTCSGEMERQRRGRMGRKIRREKKGEREKAETVLLFCSRVVWQFRNIQSRRRGGSSRIAANGGF